MQTENLTPQRWFEKKGLDMGSVMGGLVDLSPSNKKQAAKLSDQPEVKAAELLDELKEEWDMLDRSDKLEGLKDSNPAKFKKLYKAKFGKDFADKKAKESTPVFSLALADKPEAKGMAFPAELYWAWDKLDYEKRLEKLRQENVTLYVVLFNEKFGTYPKEFQQAVGQG